MKRFSFPAALLGLMLIPAAHAQDPAQPDPTLWTADPTATFMEISFYHANLIEVTTTLGKVTGSGHIDPDDMTKSDVEFTAQVNSVYSYEPRFESDIKSDQLFDAARFPTIHFQSKKIVKESGTYVAYGDLSAHGQTHPGKFTIAMSKNLDEGPVHFRGVTLTGTMDWRGYGMSYKDRPEEVKDPEYGFFFTLRAALEMHTNPKKS